MTDTSLTTLAAEITKLEAIISEQRETIKSLTAQLDWKTSKYAEAKVAYKVLLRNLQQALKDCHAATVLAESHAEAPTNGQEAPAQGTIGTLAERIRKGRRTAP